MNRLLGVLLVLGPAACGGGGAGVETPVPLPAEAVLADLDRGLVSAIEARAAAVEADPTSAAAWLALGMTYEAHSQHDLSLACYEAAAERGEGDAKVWYRLGLARARGGDLAGARAGVAQALELEPSYGAARLRLGYLALDEGDLAAARAAFEQAGEAPAALQGLAQADLEEGLPEEALGRLEEPALQEGAHRPLTQRLRGLALARLGREEEASAALAAGVGARPVIADPWSRAVGEHKVGASAVLMRARKLLDRGKPEAALELLEPLQGDDDPRVLRLLAAVHARSARFDLAGSCLERAAGLQPDDPEVFVAWASALDQQLRASEAAEVLQAFAEREPQHPEVWAALQTLATGRGDHEGAVAVRDRARSAAVELSSLEQAAGEAELALARPEAAVSSFGRALTLDEGAAVHWLGRARARLAAGDAAGAALDLARATELDPELPGLAELRARLEGEDA